MTCAHVLQHVFVDTLEWFLCTNSLQFDPN